MFAEQLTDISNRSIYPLSIAPSPRCSILYSFRPSMAVTPVPDSARRRKARTEAAAPRETYLSAAMFIADFANFDSF